jgi:hypothetical protein
MLIRGITSYQTRLSGLDKAIGHSPLTAPPRCTCSNSEEMVVPLFFSFSPSQETKSTSQQIRLEPLLFPLPLAASCLHIPRRFHSTGSGRRTYIDILDICLHGSLIDPSIIVRRRLYFTNRPHQSESHLSLPTPGMRHLPLGRRKKQTGPNCPAGQWHRTTHCRETSFSWAIASGLLFCATVSQMVARKSMITYHPEFGIMHLPTISDTIYI